MTANASDIEFSAPEYGASGQIKQLSLRARVGLSLNLKKAISDLKIRIIEPNIKYDLSAKASKKNDPSKPDQPGSSQAIAAEKDITADLEIENGKIEIVDSGILKYVIEDLSLETRYNGLNSPTSLKTRLKLSAPQFLKDTKVPIQVSSDFIFDGINFSTERCELEVAQIKAKLSGKQNIESGDGEWKVNAEARNFEAVGKISDLSIKGPITGDLATEIVLTKFSPSLRSLILAADLTRADLSYKNLFRKPSGTALVIDARGSTAGDVFSLESAKMIFDRLQTSISASIPLPTSKQKSASLTFSFSRTALSGWERFFPALSKAPVAGFVEGAGKFDGNLQDIKTYRVTISPLKLEKISAVVDWQSEDKTKSARGPVLIDGDINLVANGTNLQSAKADIVADLTKMAIEIKDVLSKPAAVVFRTELHATQKNLKEIELKKTAIQLGVNRLVVSGTIQEPQKPK